MTLSKGQLKRQDFVDNTILDCIEKLTGKTKLYDAELIGNIRDHIIEELKDKYIIIGTEQEQEFYPFINE